MPPSGPPVPPQRRPHVRRIRGTDWQQLKALRLEALADSPMGFSERHADAVGRNDGSWRRRAEGSAAGADSALFVAADVAGEWVGMLGVYRDAPGEAQVVSVYVSPRARGRGVLEDLLDEAQRWALGVGLLRLRLSVHQDNTRARAAYERLGFAPTGRTFPYALDEALVEHELDKELT